MNDHQYDRENGNNFKLAERLLCSNPIQLSLIRKSGSDNMAQQSTIQNIKKQKLILINKILNSSLVSEKEESIQVNSWKAFPSPIPDILYNESSKVKPTGIKPLDNIFCGGLPSNRIIQIIGYGSSGKTQLCIQSIVSTLINGQHIPSNNLRRNSTLNRSTSTTTSSTIINNNNINKVNILPNFNPLLSTLGLLLREICMINNITIIITNNISNHPSSTTTRGQNNSNNSNNNKYEFPDVTGSMVHFIEIVDITIQVSCTPMASTPSNTSETIISSKQYKHYFVT
eukprot:gene13763-18459_t